MTITNWISASGTWSDAADWSNGVPGAADQAVIDGPIQLSGYTISGGGAVASLSIGNTASLIGTFAPPEFFGNPVLGGTYDAGSFFAGEADIALVPGTALNFETGTLADFTDLTVFGGATLGQAPLTLAEATIEGTLGTLLNPLTVIDEAAIAASGTTTMHLDGSLSGDGALLLNGAVVVGSDVTNAFAGTLEVGVYLDPLVDRSFEVITSLEQADAPAGPSRTELAGPGMDPGDIVVASGTLLLDPGFDVGGDIVAATAGSAVIVATTQSPTIFAGIGPLTYFNGGGDPLIIGATKPGGLPLNDGPTNFGTMTVQGGAGSITVFGGNSSGIFYGGGAGNNVMAGGADLSGDTFNSAGFITSLFAYTPRPVTMFGGGSNDLLVATGSPNPFGSNILAASTGNETLTGSGSTASNIFFGGAGADLIVAGSGQSVIIAGSGPETISGASGIAAIFAGTGASTVIGGSGADYLQAGTGSTVFVAGSGSDVLGVVNGQSGGNLVVLDFKPGTDQIAPRGYAGSPVSTIFGGNLTLTFTDHTQIILLGVTSLPNGTFV